MVIRLGARMAHGAYEWPQDDLDREVGQEIAELATHVTRISRNLTNHVTFDSGVVTRLVERDFHATTPSTGEHDPGHAVDAGLLGGFNGIRRSVAHLPFRRLRGLNDAVEF